MRPLGARYVDNGFEELFSSEGWKFWDDQTWTYEVEDTRGCCENEDEAACCPKSELRHLSLIAVSYTYPR